MSWLCNLPPTRFLIAPELTVSQKKRRFYTVIAVLNLGRGGVAAFSFACGHGPAVSVSKSDRLPASEVSRTAL